MWWKGHPAFLFSPHSQSPRRTLASSALRGTHQVENTAATEESLEDRHPFGGVLQSDPALEGPGTSTTSLKEKVAVDTSLPSPRRDSSGTALLTYPPFTWWICLFPMWKKVNANLCKLYSNPAHLERLGDQLIQHRKDLLGFSPLTWKQLNLRGVFAP